MNVNSVRKAIILLLLRENGNRRKLKIARGDDGSANRCRREEKIIAESKKREEEIAAELAERKKELEARGREVKEQMDVMQAHMERLMKMVEDSKATSVAKSVCKLSGVMLVPLSERDDNEAYLVTFKRIMKAYKMEEDRWACYLAPQLTG